jgi:hypothetical protein
MERAGGEPLATGTGGRGGGNYGRMMGSFFRILWDVIGFNEI